MLLHVLNGVGSQHLVHVLGAVELVGKGIEEAVALGCQLMKAGHGQHVELTVTLDVPRIQGIGL